MRVLKETLQYSNLQLNMGQIHSTRPMQKWWLKFDILNGIYFKLLLAWLYMQKQRFFDKECANQAEKIDKNLYEVSYSFQKRSYKFLMIAERGPKRMFLHKCLDDNENDITDKVKEYLGPNMDWHKVTKLTPNMLLMNGVKLYINDSVIECRRNEDLIEKCKAIEQI